MSTRRAATPAAVETKVTAATAAATFTSFVLWLLAQYVFPGDVPAPVVGIVTLLVTGAATFAAGYMARHTPRTEDPS